MPEKVRVRNTWATLTTLLRTLHKKRSFRKIFVIINNLLLNSFKPRTSNGSFRVTVIHIITSSNLKSLIWLELVYNKMSIPIMVLIIVSAYKVLFSPVQVNLVYILIYRFNVKQMLSSQCRKPCEIFQYDIMERIYKTGHGTKGRDEFYFSILILVCSLWYDFVGGTKMPVKNYKAKYRVDGMVCNWQHNLCYFI